MYDEIDRLVESEKFDLAYEAVESAIQQYFDPHPSFRFRCLWLFRRGATIAARVGRPQVAIAYLQRFIVDAEALLNLGPHRQEVELRNDQIRPARRDEIADAKAVLPELKTATFALLRENLVEKSEDEIWAEVERCRTSLLKSAKDSSCFIATAAYGTPLDADVSILRSFRDRVLVETAMGRTMVAVYERLSPPVAMRITADGVSGAVVRACLRPVVAAVRLAARICH